MKICVMGLGYVGCVSAACLADTGHDVIGVDVNPSKVELINNGKSPIVEQGVEAVISSCVGSDRLRASCNALEAVNESEITIICVGTPSKQNGDLDTQFIENVCKDIGSALAKANARHLVVLRSTVLPGTLRQLVQPALEKSSGKTMDTDIGLCFNPEFMREGTAMEDYFSPPKIVVGSDNPNDATVVAKLYEGIDAPVFTTSIETAEMIKYVDNAFHGLKVTFANEIGNICKELNIDSHEVMDIFCSDTKLNLSKYYLKPGFAFGGSCLPKDLRALCHKAKHLDLNIPVLNSILESNEYQIQRALSMITSLDKKNIGILGLSFKAGTDDLRESPVVILAEILLGKGYSLKIFDNNINIAALTGANKEYGESHIEHISKLLCDDIKSVIDFADVIVIGNNDDSLLPGLNMIQNHQAVVDLVRLKENFASGKYNGICW